MFCTNCGEALESNARFCIGCGNAVEPDGMQEVTTPKGNSINARKFILPVAGLAAVSVIVFLVFNLIVRVGPMLAISRAMDNWGDEFTERLETTPFQAFGMLFDSLEYGTTNVNFTVRSEWEDWWTGGWRTDETRGNFSFVSNSHDREYAISGNLYSHGTDVDFSVLMNSERIAFNSRRLGRDYYGIRYSTAREDIRPFGRAVGMTNSEMDLFADFMESVGELMNQPDDDGAMDEYTEALINMLREVEQETDRVDILIGGETIRARRIEYTITHEALTSLFWDWYNILENDESVSSMFDNFPDFDGMRDMHREMMTELRNIIREFDREFGGHITLAFYIGDRNRLIRMDFNGELTQNARFAGGEREHYNFNIRLEMGASVMDTWRFNMSLSDRRGENISINGLWSFRDAGSFYSHTFEITVSERNHRDTFTFTSEWNPQSGNFDLFVTEQGRGGDVWTSEPINGNFRVDGETFRLRISYSEQGSGWSDFAEFEISTQTGANVPNVNFVNLDQWDRAFIDRLEDFIWDLGF